MVMVMTGRPVTVRSLIDAAGRGRDEAARRFGEDAEWTLGRGLTIDWLQQDRLRVTAARVEHIGLWTEVEDLAEAVAAVQRHGDG